MIDCEMEKFRSLEKGLRKLLTLGVAYVTLQTI